MMKRKALHIVGLVLALGFESLAQPCPYAWEPVQRLSETPGANFTSKLGVVADTVHAIYYGGTFDQRFYYRRSTDQGKNWQVQVAIIDSVHPQTWNRSLSVSGSHVYVVSSSAFSAPVTAIKVTRSTDGGLTWLPPQDIVTVISGVASYTGQLVASSGPHVYITVNRTWPNPQKTFMRRSTDWGETWDSLRQITSGTWGDGAWDIRAEGPVVHVVLGVDAPPSRQEMGYIQSSDYGLTWTPTALLSSVDSFQGWEPQLASNGQGNVYVGWQDAKYGTVGGFAGTLLLRGSTDNGVTWLPEQRISSIASAERSTLTATNNIVYAAWWDNRSGNLTPRVYARGSADYGVTWCDEHLVGDPTLVSSSPNLASQDGYVHLSLRVNVDTLGPKVYYTRREIITSVSDGRYQLPLQAKLLAPYPNPFNSQVTISFELPRRGTAVVRLYDMLGREVSELANAQFEGGVHHLRYSGATSASGVYFVTLFFGGRREVKPILLLR